jgi:hypothetical protein
MDWNAEAKRVADYIHQQIPAPRRGAVTFGAADRVVLFGNESSEQGDGACGQLVQHLRSNIPANYSEAGFNTSDLGNGSTWAIILRAHMGAANVETMHRLVWDSYSALFPGNEPKVAQHRDVKHAHIQPLPQGSRSVSRT